MVRWWSAGGPLVVCRWSAGDPWLAALQAGETTVQALLLALLLGSSVMGGLWLNADSVLTLMGLDHSDMQLRELALQFLYIRRRGRL